MNSGAAMLVLREGRKLFGKSLRSREWGSARLFSAQPATNDADYEKFSSDSSRSHVTVRGRA